MKYDELFTPGSVDEQVDQLSSLAMDESLLPNARLVQHSTERVWVRLERQVSESDSVC